MLSLRYFPLKEGDSMETINKADEKWIFSQNLNRALRISGKTQAEVADLMHVSRSSMNMWCKGTMIPRMPKIQKLASIFHIPVSHLVDPPASWEDETKGVWGGEKDVDAYDVTIENSRIVKIEKENTYDSTIQRLMAYILLLNGSGIDKLLERAEELSEMDKYKKE